MQVTTTQALLLSVGVGGVLTIGLLVILWRAVDHLARSKPPEAPAILPPSTATSAENLRKALRKFIEDDDTMPLLDVLGDVTDPLVTDFIDKLRVLSTSTPVGTTNDQQSPTSVVNVNVSGVDPATAAELQKPEL